MAGPTRYKERIHAAPFVAWVNGELERLAAVDVLREESMNEVPASRILAERLNVNERTIYRWRRSLDSITGEHTDEIARASVEDALHAADVEFADLYPDVAAADDVELEPDAYCLSCHDVVTPIAGACPWCDRPVSRQVPSRMYCKREDKMSFPALDGNCWRCGGALKPHPPKAPCGCGCGELVYRFDRRRGAAVRFAVGHAPRTLERKRSVPVGPLADWLEQQLRDLDPIQSLARRVGLHREEVLDILARRVETVDWEQARRVLWHASREGQGKGMAARPGSLYMRDLYPEHVRSTVCPGCEGEKSFAAELCRRCRADRGAAPGSRRSLRMLSDEVLAEAHRLREQEGLPFAEIAKRLQHRTLCTNSDSFKHALRAEFQKRGWPTARLDQVRLAA